MSTKLDTGEHAHLDSFLSGQIWIEVLSYYSSLSQETINIGG